MSPNIFDHIGFYGPFILIGINIFSLWKRMPYLYSYINFLIINKFINKILKLSFREPRPNNQIHYNDYFDKYVGEQIYGMPSGHAQSIFYSISFLYLATKSPIVLIISLFIAALTLYQRWKYRNHTFAQLIIGSIVGILFGSSVYYYTNKYLHSY